MTNNQRMKPLAAVALKAFKRINPLANLSNRHFLWWDSCACNSLMLTAETTLERRFMLIFGRIPLGPVLASTDLVFMPDGFGIGNGNRGYTNFFFSTPAVVVPGVTYYLQPVVQSGDAWGIVSYNYGYPGGSIFLQGVANPIIDLWFREGIYIVPEPSSALLVLLGGGLVAWRHRKTRLSG